MKITFDYKEERVYILLKIHNLWEILKCIEEQTKENKTK